MDNQIEGLSVRQERNTRRDNQQASFHRNQALGLLIAAAAVLLYRLFHTPAGWLFPTGWWRLW